MVPGAIHFLQLVYFQLTPSLSLGLSSGRGALSIWTHNLKGREWHDSFVVKSAPHGTGGIPAVTLQAGEQWLGDYASLFRHQ